MYLRGLNTIPGPDKLALTQYFLIVDAGGWYANTYRTDDKTFASFDLSLNSLEFAGDPTNGVLRG